MVGHRGAPGVENGGDGDVGAQVPGVGCDGEHGLGRGLEQDVIDHRLVLVGDVDDRAWQREYQVEVRHRQEFGLARFEPLPGCWRLALGAVPVTATNGRRPLVALWADPVMGSWLTGITIFW